MTRTLETLTEALDWIQPRWARFWEKVDKSGECWVWTAALSRTGYGKFGVKRRPMEAHRLAWLGAFGVIPPDMEVCHRCDNPPCVRPSHLFLASHRENMQDMWRKGRGVRNSRPFPGSSNPRARLTEADIPQIRASLQGGETARSIARRYNVVPQTIGIKTGRSWGHVA